MCPIEEAAKVVPEKSGGSQPITARIEDTEIRNRGEAVRVSSIQIGDLRVVSAGKWLRMATVQDEEVQEGNALLDPDAFISRLKASGLKADIFTFAQELPHTTPNFNFHTEWDSLAVIPITTYADWWEKRAAHDVRTAVKKSAKLGVKVREAQFDDKFVEGIVQIYNECEFRQGKRFWHYGKDFDTVKLMSSTYLDRSTFIGAYLNDELIGFIKMVRVNNISMTFHVISMKKYSNKKPTNALLAKAVEICAEKGNSHLMYGNFVYKDPESSLTEFKRRNGFEEALVPRYYIPLTLKGKMALRAKLHHSIGDILPLPMWRIISRLRARVVQYRKSDSD